MRWPWAADLIVVAVVICSSGALADRDSTDDMEEAADSGRDISVGQLGEEPLEMRERSHRASHARSRHSLISRHPDGDKLDTVEGCKLAAADRNSQHSVQALKGCLSTLQLASEESHALNTASRTSNQKYMTELKRIMVMIDEKIGKKHFAMDLKHVLEQDKTDAALEIIKRLQVVKDDAQSISPS
mmetsp:Transcript_91946/g.168606  ORF Transcript_91946/g.168606 Transcript_91946/m.168606 type:complete len:186 (+) Transcript_91946:80-637(+)